MKLIHLSQCTIATALFLIQPMAFAQSVKLTPEQAIEQTFRSDTPLPGTTKENHQNLMKIRSQVQEWLGSYQGVRAEKDRSIVLFERGSIPVEVNFRANGEPDTIGATCPTTSVPLSQAPREIQEAFSPCSNLKR